MGEEEADVAARYLSDNIGSWTALRARRDPERTALVCGEQRVSYEELERNAARVAGALREAGVKPGRRVATALKNRVEFVELLFGTARAGAIFVPLNFRLSSEEVAYALSDSGAEIVFVQADTAAAVTAALELATPAATPPSTATKAITVTRPEVVCPLVVIVEFAQRRTASLASRTITAQPCSRAPIARPPSTTSWARHVPVPPFPVTAPPPGC